MNKSCLTLSLIWIPLFLANGDKLFIIPFSSSFILTFFISRSALITSIFVSIRSLSIILDKRSISLLISCRNSCTIDISISCICIRVSASILMELKGVFNSWDASDTNWRLFSSTEFKRSTILLKAAPTWAISSFPLTSTLCFRFPSDIPLITRISCSTGPVITLAKKKLNNPMRTLTTIAIPYIFLLKSFNKSIIFSPDVDR